MLQKSHNPAIRRDILKLTCFVAAVIGAAALFFGTPALTLPTLCSIVLTTVFSPWVSNLERRGFSRTVAILILFVALGSLMALSVVLVARSWNHEWLSFQANAPEYFSSTIDRISKFEAGLKGDHPFLRQLNLAESLSNWGNNTGGWFAANLPGFVSSFVGCLFLVPIITFCLLSEGRSIRRRFFQLVPNRFFESVFIVTHGVSSALSDYARAKLIEAFLVGVITTLGLSAIHSSYAIVLGIWAGVTNILPYIGPVFGALPALLIAMLDSQGGSGMVWATAGVYGTAYLIDSVVIFPGIVAKLVKLNPLILTASVVLGQYYGGIIGMLVSIPIAAAIKVVLTELYFIVYG